jgi:hypothetical protein
VRSPIRNGHEMQSPGACLLCARIPCGGTPGNNPVFIRTRLKAPPPADFRPLPFALRWKNPESSCSGMVTRGNFFGCGFFDFVSSGSHRHWP